jgi:hypothetical protein
VRTTELLSGAVKYPARSPLDTVNGPRINVVIALGDGSEAKLWGNPGDAIARLRKGDLVRLMYDGKGYALLEPETIAPPPVATQVPAPGEEPVDVLEWLDVWAALERYRPDLDEATRRAATNTIFMSRRNSPPRVDEPEYTRIE